MTSPLFKKIKIEIPTVPNFIMVGEQNMAVSSFTEEELREIAAEWTERLILKAKTKKI